MEDIEENMQNFIGHKIRQSQNSVQIFHCLTNSMTEASHLNIVVESINYMDDETPVSELILKLMMQKSIIDTKYTATHLR